MFCGSCGTKNAENARFCASCGKPMGAAAGAAPPPPPPLPQYSPPPAQHYPPPPPQYSPPPPPYAQQQPYSPPPQQQQAFPPPAYGAVPPVPGVPQPNIATHLVLAIITTVLCCLPLGVMGVVYASQVKAKLAVGDVAGAQAASGKAKLFSILGMVLGLIGIVIYGAQVMEQLSKM